VLPPKGFERVSNRIEAKEEDEALYSFGNPGAHSLPREKSDEEEHSPAQDVVAALEAGPENSHQVPSRKNKGGGLPFFFSTAEHQGKPRQRKEQRTPKPAPNWFLREQQGGPLLENVGQRESHVDPKNCRFYAGSSPQKSKRLQELRRKDPKPNEECDRKKPGRKQEEGEVALLEEVR
jgi:hypothetical protein